MRLSEIFLYYIIFLLARPLLHFSVCVWLLKRKSTGRQNDWTACLVLVDSRLKTTSIVFVDVILEMFRLFADAIYYKPARRFIASMTKIEEDVFLYHYLPLLWSPSSKTRLIAIKYEHGLMVYIGSAKWLFVVQRKWDVLCKHVLRCDAEPSWLFMVLGYMSHGLTLGPGRWWIIGVPLVIWNIQSNKFRAMVLYVCVCVCVCCAWSLCQIMTIL